MNDFVMSVVNEVLNQKKTGNTVKNFYAGETNALERPNYQRQNSKKRMLVYDLPMLREQKPEARINQLSELCRKSMEAHENEKTYDEVCKAAPAAFEGTTSGSDFICFPLGNNNNMKRLVGFPYCNKEAACMGMQENCYISQLFAVDELLRKFPTLDFSVKWSVNQNEPFVFQAVGTTDMMQAAQDLLNQYYIKDRDIQIVNQPTQYLKKTLNISADTIGAIEGVHYAKLIPQAVSYFSQHEESMVECCIFGSYLIFYGQLSQVQQILENLNHK